MATKQFWDDFHSQNFTDPNQGPYEWVYVMFPDAAAFDFDPPADETYNPENESESDDSDIEWENEYSQSDDTDIEWENDYSHSDDEDIDWAATAATLQEYAYTVSENFEPTANAAYNAWCKDGFCHDTSA